MGFNHPREIVAPAHLADYSPELPKLASEIPTFPKFRYSREFPKLALEPSSFTDSLLLKLGTRLAVNSYYWV